MMVIFNSSFLLVGFFFFKQKTAYEMRISDWSSDVCLPICRDPPGPAPWQDQPGEQDEREDEKGGLEQFQPVHCPPPPPARKDPVAAARAPPPSARRPRPAHRPG